jgi:hypothetical protein
MIDLNRSFEGFQTMKISMRKILSGLALAWILAGCTNTALPAPAATASSPQVVVSPTPSSCVVGIWEIKDKEAFLRALVPVGAFDPEQLEFVKAVGSVAYRFDNDGVVTVEAVSFQGRYDVKMGIELGILDIRLTGFASGNYVLAGDSIQVVDMLSSEMSYHAYFQGEDMMADAKANAFLPLFVSPFNSATFECGLDSLNLEFVNHPGIQAPLEFKRLR